MSVVLKIMSLNRNDKKAALKQKDLSLKQESVSCSVKIGKLKRSSHFVACIN